MNVLFYNTFKVSSTKGGTEHASITVANGLSKYYGCKCYSIYGIDASTPKEDCFEEEFFMQKCTPKSIAEILIKCAMDIVLIQGDFNLLKTFRLAIDKYHLHCKLVFAHHFSPGWELHYNTKSEMIKYLNPIHVKSFLKTLYHLCRYDKFRYQYESRLHEYYRDSYLYADHIVLLSKSYIAPFIHFAGINDATADKFSHIPNAVSFNEWITEKEMSQKQNIVLVVARLDENQKRISEILKIWKNFEEKYDFPDWKLNIVGDGEDRKAYEDYINQNNIKNIRLLGRRTPIEEYRKAKIFLMTSKSEGYPLTISEAKQMGVVPISYNSYSSVYEIIQDGFDGYIVENEDRNTMLNKLLFLIMHSDVLLQMSRNSVASSKNNSLDLIAKQWNALFEMLINQYSVNSNVIV